MILSYFLNSHLQKSQEPIHFSSHLAFALSNILTHKLGSIKLKYKVISLKMA